MMKFSAVLFDLDGVIVDSEKYYAKFHMEAAKELGVELTFEDALHMRSLSTPLRIEYFKGKYGESYPYDDMIAIERNMFNDHVERNGLELKPHVKDILDYSKKKGMTTAIATSSAKESMEKKVSLLGIGDRFDRIVSASMVKNGKPAPDVYLYVCRELGLEPSECIAVEDSPNGLRSAYDAGCNPVFIPDLSQPDDEVKRMAYRIFPSLEGLKELY